MKRWEVQNKLKVQNAKFKVEELIDLLLENRGIGKEEREHFITPKLEDVTPKTVGIDLKQLQKALKRIQKAIVEKEQIIVFGDYDVDGITGSAILWETLHSLGANARPYIPHRIDEGYGLSIKGIENLNSQFSTLNLIITVDNGIVANEAVAFANQQGIDVIITDHHTVGEKLPDAYAVVHTTKLCGAGVALLLSKEIRNVIASKAKQSSTNGIAASPMAPRNDEFEDTHLELAALGTVADLVPLTGANRTIVKYGLEKLAKTKRPGLLHLFKQAKLDKDIFTTYDVGFIIAPRLNAAGRIESAMDSLRLLCTNSFDRAEMLAEQLELTNRERQLIMKASADSAVSSIKYQVSSIKKILIVADESYQEGVIGLVAGKLVEEFYRPAIVIAKREQYSKASVRSVSGFNIVDFLRSSFDEFVNIGGHPMAAGFTVETNKLQLLKERLEQLAEEAVVDDMLTKTLKVDCEIPLSIIMPDLFNSIQQLAPFGMANQEPTFVSRSIIVENMRILGKDSTHLKLVVRDDDNTFDAIAFKMADRAIELNIGDTIDLVYTIDTNTWNGKTTLQLKVKDLHPS